MIVDVHTHLSTRQQWGPVFCEGFDQAYSDTAVDLHGTPERHHAAMANVDKAIVFGINSKAMQMATPHESIAAYARQYPDKIIGFMSIDPHEPDALDEINRCVNELGLRGIKMSPVYQNYHPCDSRAQRVHERAEALGLPILTHAAFHFAADTPMEWANPLHYDPVARQFPELKIILAHVGLPWFTDAMVMVRKNRNVYADISGAMLRPWWCYQALAVFHESGILQKLLFGTDWPIILFDQTINGLRRVNDVVEGTAMPKIPPDEIEALIHRDSLSLLGLA